MVEAAAIRRRLLTSANTIATLAYNEQESVENVIEEFEKSIFNVSPAKSGTVRNSGKAAAWAAWSCGIGAICGAPRDARASYSPVS